MKVGIIGAAGSVGAPVAFYTAISGLATEILLVDLRLNVAQQHALDIGTAASAQGVKVSAGTLDDLVGFDGVINAAGARQSMIVEGTVIGEHGPTQVPLFSSVRVDGRVVEFTREERAGILAEIPNILRRYEALQSGRTAGWTCAVGMATLVRAIRDDTGEVLPCSAVVDGEYGYRRISVGVPVSVGRSGIGRIEQWRLTEEEQAALGRSAATLEPAARTIDE